MPSERERERIITCMIYGHYISLLSPSTYCFPLASSDIAAVWTPEIVEVVKFLHKISCWSVYNVCMFLYLWRELASKKLKMGVWNALSNGPYSSQKVLPSNDFYFPLSSLEMILDIGITQLEWIRVGGYRGVNVRPNPRTRHEPNTGFSGLGLGLNGFGS